MSGWMHDLRGAANLLRRRPLFTAATVGTLALGIAANSTIFGLVEATILRKPALPDPDRLVVVREVGTEGQEMQTSWPTFLDWQRSGVFRAAGAYAAWPVTVLGGPRPQLLQVARVSRGFFDAVGTAPLAGRLPRPEEHLSGVAVVSEGYWRDALGGAAPGTRRLDIEGKTFDVVGVLPASFDLPSRSQVWLPVEAVMGPPLPYRSAHNFRVVGRLAPHVGVADAERRLDALTRRVARTGADPAEAAAYLPVGAHVRTLQAETAKPVREPLLLLLGAAAFVLLVACLNLASSFLARGVERERELAVRTALGASRVALLRQLVAEALLLAALGGVAGLLLAATLGRLVLAAAPPLVAEAGLRLNGGVGGYTALAAVASVLLIGLLPALLVTRTPAGSLRGSGRGQGISRAQRRTWSVLVAVQAALALLLLTGAGLLLRSFVHLLAVEPGFATDRVEMVSLVPPPSHYADGAALAALQERVLQAASGLPEVEVAGLVSDVPLTGDQGGDMRAAPDVHGSASYRLATAGYFRALRIPLVAGRLFDDLHDRAGAPHVAIVDRAAAQMFWPGQSPLGKRISSEGMDEWGALPGTEPKAWATVVGVVGDVRQSALEKAPRPSVYFAIDQRPSGSATLVARSRTTAAALAPALRRTLAAAAPDVAADDPAPLSRVLEAARAQKRFALLLLGVFAGLTLLLAAVGVYGVVAYAVSRRTREIGVRLALGAAPAQARDLLVRGSLLPVACGVAIGLVAALGLGRVLASQLYEVPASDPASWVGATLLLATVALLASWLPARRAARIDPQLALRAE